MFSGQINKILFIALLGLSKGRSTEAEGDLSRSRPSWQIYLLVRSNVREMSGDHVGQELGPRG